MFFRSALLYRLVGEEGSGTQNSTCVMQLLPSFFHVRQVKLKFSRKTLLKAKEPYSVLGRSSTQVD